MKVCWQLERATFLNAYTPIQHVHACVTVSSRDHHGGRDLFPMTPPRPWSPTDQIRLWSSYHNHHCGRYLGSRSVWSSVTGSWNQIRLAPSKWLHVLLLVPGIFIRVHVSVRQSVDWSVTKTTQRWWIHFDVHTAWPFSLAVSVKSDEECSVWGFMWMTPEARGY